jgi:hypothetical protein
MIPINNSITYLTRDSKIEDQKEYIVILKNYNDLDSFYSDMESENTAITLVCLEV